jgi:hypothetical protein
MSLKKLFAILFVLVFVTACGAKPVPTEPPPPPATNTPVPTATATETPTATPIPPTPTPEFLQYYTEEFDKDLKYWPYFIVDGWNSAIMTSPDTELEVVDGAVRFELPKWRWVYVTYDPFEYKDVRIEAQAENLGTNNNNISLICRYTKDGWYEFNIANNGLYWIYRTTIKTNGAVSYTLLEEGGSNNIVQGNTPGRNTNTYAISCKGSDLTLYINDDMTKQAKDSILTSGKVGVSVSSFATGVNVRFNSVKISEP